MTPRSEAEPAAGSDVEPVLRRWALRFPDAGLERAFRQDYDATGLPVVRRAAVLAAVLYVAFAGLDVRIAEDGVRELVVMRAVVVVALLAALVTTFTSWGQQRQQQVLCGATLLGGAGIASMNVIAEVPLAVPALGMTLTLVFVFTFVRLRFGPSVVTAALLLVVYEVTLALSAPPLAVATYLTAEVVAFFVIGASVSYTLERLWRLDFLRRLDLERERQRSDSLLHVVLPESIARRLRVDPRAIADAADDVTVLFADLVGFTSLTARVDPRVLVAALGRLFATFDELCDQQGVEKIKTMGDGYLAVAGVPDPHPDGAGAVARLALDLRDAVGQLSDPDIGELELRVGIATGPVVAGVIGRRRLAYDLWGDTVNLASRLESQGAAGVVQVCPRTYDLLRDRAVLDGPHRVEVKGRGPVEAWHLVGWPTATPTGRPAPGSRGGVAP